MDKPMPSRRVTVLAAAIAVIAAAAILLYRPHGGVHESVTAAPPSLAMLKSETPHAVPDVTFSNAAGEHHDLSSYKGRYVLLNLWATWCAPCVKELPALAKLQSAVAPGKLTVLTVNVGQGSAADTATFMKSHNASALPVNLDADSSFIRAFGAFGLPLSVLIDPQGREVARAVGPADWDAAPSIDYFKALTHTS
jgi:thiol-disulfide isomerase/thioredoxin